MVAQAIKNRETDRHNNMQHYIILHFASPGVEGGRYLTKFYTGILRPEAQPLIILCNILAEKVPLSDTYFRKSCSHFHVVLNK